MKSFWIYLSSLKAVGVFQVSSCMVEGSLWLMTKIRPLAQSSGLRKPFIRANGKPSCQELRMRRRGTSACCWKAWEPVMYLKSEFNHNKTLCALLFFVMIHSWQTCELSWVLSLPLYPLLLSFSSPDEVRSLWIQLRRDEPHLLSNFEEFLARVTHQIKEAHQEKKEMESALQR